MGAVRLLGRLRRHGQRLLGRPRRRRPGRADRASSADNGGVYPIPALVVRGVPADVRDHHAGADLAAPIADRAKFRTLDASSSPSGSRSSTSRSRTGSSTSAAPTGAERRLARRTTSGRSTSPAARRSTSTPVPPAWRSRSCSASASAGRRTPMRPHNLPLVLLGAGLLWFGWFGFNAGSALAANSTAAVGLHQHAGRHRRRRRSAGSSSEKLRDGHATTPRRRLRRGRRPGRHHPGLLRSSAPLGAIVLGLLAGVALRPGRRAEVPVRLRRLARRRRRPPRRRPRRPPAHRLLRPPPTSTGRRRTACSTAAASSLLGQAGRRGAFSVLGYSFVVTLRHRLRSSTRRSGFRITEDDEVERHRPHRAR